ncbi:hypothetical protein [Tropicibacter oceani]|uniref:Uncharacterized protein n=1 Tax=Tropicibacter oceani TaxID=3058420 RepID=A0ABY8QFB8_9RHOB|nr:hypothetical protein [Tropicibacter oceani]WGW03304.1 hypothetical protein QF118_15435 [Tropicibacter oceani]
MTLGLGAALAAALGAALVTGFSVPGIDGLLFLGLSALLLGPALVAFAIGAGLALWSGGTWPPRADRACPFSRRVVADGYDRSAANTWAPDA